MRPKSKGFKQNTHRPLPYTELSCPNPERIALDTLIEISNEPAAQELDHKILKTEEAEILPHRSVEFISKSAAKPRVIIKPSTAGEFRSRSNHNGTNRHLQRSSQLQPHQPSKQYTRQYRPYLHHQPLSQQLSKQISSNTVFIRKMSPSTSHKKKDSFSAFILPLRTKSKLRISPQPSDIFSRIDNTIFFNHTINFGNRQIREDLQEVLGGGGGKGGGAEGRRRGSREKMNMTHRVSGSAYRQRNRLSIMNIEFPSQQTARLASFCL